MNPAETIIEFCQVLRGLGVRVGTTEALDAASALAVTDWSDPGAFRTALQATLVKRPDDRALFAQAFATYFRPRQRHCDCPGHRQAVQAEADPEFLFQGKPLDIPDDLKQVHKKMAPEDQRRIAEFLERTSTGHNVTEKFQSIAERMVTGSLDYWRRQLAEQELQGLQVDYTGNPRIDAALEDSTEALQASLPALMRRDLGRIAESELPMVQQLLKRMARALATQLSRRRRRTRATEQVDLRRTIRANLRYGGTLIKVSHRQRSRTKPKLLLLCDISGSMVRYVTFVLQFLTSVANLAFNIESFAFAEGLERLTPSFRAHPSMQELLASITGCSTQWGKGTLLHQSLATLLAQHRRVVQPGTVVIILSDTKTLQAEAAAEELAHLRRSVKEVLWLNTLPREEWSRSRTTQLFQRQSRMFPCSTLADLAQVVGREVFRLRR